MRAVSTRCASKRKGEARTYISERVDEQGTGGMNEDTDTEDIDETDGYDEVPDEISRHKGLDHTASTGISPYASLPVESLALLIDEHTP